MESPIGNEQPGRGIGPHPHDPRTLDAARRVVELIAEAVMGARAEHVGSSSVPGLAGKNIVDVLLPADPAEIPGVTDALAVVGFQRQGGRDPFPPTRPMLEGSIREQGEVFLIHLHVVPLGDPEIEEMLADSFEYAERKGQFVIEILHGMGFPVERHSGAPPEGPPKWRVQGRRYTRPR